MKFSDGHWRIPENLSIQHPLHIHEVKIVGDEVIAEVAALEFKTRLDQINATVFTLRLSAPAEGVIGVRITHFEGERPPRPEFALNRQPGAARIEENDRSVTLHSGGLAATLPKSGPYCLDFLRNGKRITGSATKAGGHAVDRDTALPYMFERLDLTVGTNVYGLGERFTPFVKNGQSVEIWNDDGGTQTDKAYKNIPFFVTNRGWGLLVNHPGRVSFEIATEKVTKAQFSVKGESLEYLLIDGPTPKEVVTRYTALTGRPALPPVWSFGLWLSTSFTTQYDEATVNSFVDGMLERDIPLGVFHFDCFWMRGLNWCDFEWDPEMFPDPAGQLARLKERGLHVCVWINPYIAQRSPLFAEGRDEGYLLKRPNGDVWQWDHWQPGMAFVDFTNPAAVDWYRGHLKRLLDMGVDCFKTDFGERIPTDVVWHDGSDPERMHNYYTFLYNKTVFELLQQEKGDDAIVFARSATVGWPAVPGPLGRRLRIQLRVDGREPSRRAVAGARRLRLLEPRHLRLRRHRAAGPLQALVRLRPAVEPQPSARHGKLPRSVDLRRGGGRSSQAFHPAEMPADALPLRNGEAGEPDRRSDDARHVPRIPRRSRRRLPRPAVHARRRAAGGAGIHQGRRGRRLSAAGALDASPVRRGEGRRLAP